MVGFGVLSKSHRGKNEKLLTFKLKNALSYVCFLFFIIQE